MSKSHIVHSNIPGKDNNWGSIDQVLRIPHLADAIFGQSRRSDLFNYMRVGTQWYNAVLPRLYCGWIIIRSMAAFNSFISGFMKGEDEESDLIPKWTKCTPGRFHIYIHPAFLESDFDLTWISQSRYKCWPSHSYIVYEMSFLNRDQHNRPYSGLFDLLIGSENQFGIKTLKPKAYKIDEYNTLRKSDAARWEAHYPSKKEWQTRRPIARVLKYQKDKGVRAR